MMHDGKLAQQQMLVWAEKTTRCDLTWAALTHSLYGRSFVTISSMHIPNAYMSTFSV